MLTKIEATYRTITPMFCAGADVKKPELRLMSFKGALRFWWRALAWPRLAGDLSDIQSQEDRLFGNTTRGQGRIHMRFVQGHHMPTEIHKTDTVLPAEDGARYLGYGVMEAFGSRRKNKKAGQLTRACLQAPFKFTVHLYCRDLCEAELALLRDALGALGAFGGLGAKSRKGYGSIMLQSLLMNDKPCWNAPISMDDLRARILSLSSKPDVQSLSGYPEYTAFSAKTRHVLLSSGETEPLAMLNLVGREMVRYRSWGRNKKILGGVESEQNFKDDHDLMKNSRPDRHPRRIAFGLPHNYGKKQVVPHGQGIDRRASPLFIHIHMCRDTPVAVLSFLPAWFLPKEKCYISVDGTKIRMMNETELYGPIHDFLNRLLDANKRKEKFSGSVEVQP